MNTQEQTPLRQTLKIQHTGSLVNWLMANNSSMPEVGKGATLLSWSDRSPVMIVEVDADGRGCSYVDIDAEPAKPGEYMSETPREGILISLEEAKKKDKTSLRFRNGAWRIGHEDPDGKKHWSKVNIVFGFAEKYYDHSF